MPLPINIPPQFFASLTPEEFRAIWDRGGLLNAEQCARLWRLSDRQDTPPTSLKLLFPIKETKRAWLKMLQERQSS